MNNNIQIFSNPEFGQIRTITMDNGEVGFLGKDVAEVLGYKNPSNAIVNHVDEEDKTSYLIQVSGSNYKANTVFINESGLYALILSSKLPKAREFKRWVTSDILPSIRKHGAYMTDSALHRAVREPDFLIRLATEIKKERELRVHAEQTCRIQQETINLLDSKVDGLEREVDAMKEKVSYLDIILATKNSVLVTQIAQDYGESSIKFNRRLNKMNIQYSRGKQWILYAPYKDCGYVTSETYLIKHKNGTEEVRMNTKWTQKGRQFLYETLKAVGVLPVIERI